MVKAGACRVTDFILLVAFAVKPDESPAVQVTQPYYFAEGHVAVNGFQEWLCLVNTLNEPRIAEVAYKFNEGEPPMVENNLIPHL